MADIDALIRNVRTQPRSVDSLLALIDLYLDETTSAAQRGVIRAAAADPDLKTGFENLYFEGESMDQPDLFLRRMIAALFMTAGFSDPDTARRIVGELRVFAEHHHLVFDAYRDAVRALPGARPVHPKRFRFLVMNGALIGTLVLGTVALQMMAEPLRILVQIGLLLAVAGGQMALLFWYFQM
ncbi:MAG: hypothetical protein K8J31_23285 [Anaerolineae bacterium]|nr:hypothetical protein [Anaerolineae bacterium]